MYIFNIEIKNEKEKSNYLVPSNKKNVFFFISEIILTITFIIILLSSCLLDTNDSCGFNIYLLHH